MTTDPETTQHDGDAEGGSGRAGGGVASGGAEGVAAAGVGEGVGDEGAASSAEGEEAEAGGADEGAEGAAGGSEGAGGGDSGGGDKPELSEAQAELVAQKVERERIARRKAEKEGTVASGAKLTGTAAELLAAVRAVESGAKPVSVPVAVRATSVGPASGTPGAGASGTGGTGTPGAATATSPAGPAQATPDTSPFPGSPNSPGTHVPSQGLSSDQRPIAATTTGAPSTAPHPMADVPSTPLPPEAVAAVRAVLIAGGAPEGLAPQVAALHGEGAGELLREDPWQLLRVPGVRPEQADGFARALLGGECGPDDERRGRALTVWLLEQAALAGHTVLELDTLTGALAQRGVPDAEEAVRNALDEGEALLFQDPLEEAAPAQDDDEEELEPPTRALVGLERYALAEESLAEGLGRISNSLPKDATQEWDTASAPRGAAELIRAVAAHPLVLHTGGESSRTEPAALVTAAQAQGLRVIAACHTPEGRARFARLLGDGAGEPTDAHAGIPAHLADTIVTLPALLSGTQGPGRDSDGTLAVDLLIVLDAPQLDVEIGAMLVESLADGTRLVFSGDPGVLGSAGAGRVFGDLLSARGCPQVTSRVPDPGPLGELVSGIGIGELNQVDAPGKEIVIVPVRDAGEAVHRTVQLVADSVPRAFGTAAGETVVITPGHGGAAGTRALNSALKERLNPGPGKYAGYDPGDLVAYSPAPGRTTQAHVTKADATGLHLSCVGAQVIVPKDQVESHLRHGWAVTAHQAAGTRWPAAVVVLPGDAAQSLSRPWIYTAFSRAERHLSVVHGVDQALPRAVAETPAKPRTTRLQDLLRTQLAAVTQE